MITSSSLELVASTRWCVPYETLPSVAPLVAEPCCVAQVGTNDDRFGVRFPPMSRAYDEKLQLLAATAARDVGAYDKLRQGAVYACVCGPSYETPHEIEMLRTLGCDQVGMSTIQEVRCGRGAPIGRARVDVLAWCQLVVARWWLLATATCGCLVCLSSPTSASARMTTDPFNPLTRKSWMRAARPGRTCDRCL